MSKIAFIGPKNYYRVFRFLGFSCFESKKEEETKNLIKKLKEDSFDLIFTTEDLISSGDLGVVVLPGIKEMSQEGKKSSLKEQVEKALGGAVSTSFLDSN